MIFRTVFDARYAPQSSFNRVLTAMQEWVAAKELEEPGMKSDLEGGGFEVLT